MEIPSIGIDEIEFTSTDAIGHIFNFDGIFRTKNVPYLDDLNSGKFELAGDIDRDPHIYKKRSDDYKVILMIDPRWLCSTTAFVNFRPSSGQGNFAGCAIVKSVDLENKVVIAAPIVIGLNKTLLDELFYRGFLNEQVW